MVATTLVASMWPYNLVAKHSPIAKKDQDPIGNYPQTQAKVQEWNQGVYDRLYSSNKMNLAKDQITIVDVFEASLNTPHVDNIHLSGEWYQELGIFFQQVANNIIVNTTNSHQ